MLILISIYMKYELYIKTMHKNDVAKLIFPSFLFLPFYLMCLYYSYNGRKLNTKKNNLSFNSLTNS